jgi:uncharacterized protein (TIRG00374 family)
MRARITRPQALILATVAITVLAVAAAFRDIPAVGRALRDFNWPLLAPALGLSAVMHLLRFARWHLYAVRAAAGVLGAGESLLIYGAGMGTHLTPGRAGEAVRFVFLRRATNTPVARSAPILLVERLTDGVGLLSLALPGALLLGLGGMGTVWVLAGLLFALPLLASRRVHRRIVAMAHRTPLIRRYIAAIEEAVEELRGMLTPRLLLIAILLSTASVALEVGTFAVVLMGVGIELNADTLIRAAFVLPAAMMVSGLVIVPGNLGVAEGGIAALTRVTLAVPAAAAAGAAILVRFCTLWLGLFAGWLALAIATRRWGGAAIRDA